MSHHLPPPGERTRPSSRRATTAARTLTLDPGFDPGPLLLAAAATAGAVASRPLPTAVVAAAAALAFARPRRMTVALAVLLLASWLGARAWSGLDPPAAAAVDGWVTLLNDPDRRDGAVRVEARALGRRTEAWVRGAAASDLMPRLAGEQVRISGRLSALPPDQRRRLAPRHVSARLTIASVDDWQPGSALSRTANRLRRLLVGGASSLPAADRALYAGVVFGDDREQDDGTVADFRASGLSHLLAVSGQNVAFALAVARPLLHRLPLHRRWLAALAVLVLFGTITRWEPSVTRATAMAAVTATATTFGRPVDGARVLALAVTALLLVDPLLVHALGFRLSVAACAGIAFLSRPIRAGLRGPAAARDALAITMAAQIGVAPVLLPTFGSLPLASIPANLLAAPLAGPLMAWGLSAGAVAGMVGGMPAAALHLPTLAMTRVLGGIAAAGARLPLGQLRPAHVPWLVVAAAVLVLRHRRRRAGRPRVAAPAAVVALAVSVAVALIAALCTTTTGGSPEASEGGVSLARGARLWRGGGAAVLVLDGARPAVVLDGLRSRSVRRIDVAIAPGGRRADADVLALLEGRVTVRSVLVPVGGQVGGVTPRPGSVVQVGGLAIETLEVEPKLKVRVRRSNPPW